MVPVKSTHHGSGGAGSSLGCPWRDRLSTGVLPQGFLVLLFLLGVGRPSAAQQDEKLLKRIEKLDTRFLKAFEQLAKQYDELKDPEAAHFLAECAISFGSKDEKVKAIRASWEVLVFVGKFRGGVVTPDPAPIVTGLGNFDSEYQKIVDQLVAQAKKEGISDETKKVLHECAVKHELARGAHEYIQATQRINALRKAMGLRGVLWEFEASSKYIGAAWYMAQTGDALVESKYEESRAKSIYHTPAVELSKKLTSRLVGDGLRDIPERLRPEAHVRADLLNPNARRLHLASWVGGRVINPMTLYAIPQLAYRADIPTPEKRFSDETIVQPWDGWVDTEDTFLAGSKRVAYSRYPYEGEPDAPNTYKGGETGWGPQEVPFLAKAGLPIMIRFFTEGSTADVEAELKDKNGEACACRVYKDGDPRLINPDPWPTVLVLPEKALRPRTTYTIRVKCTVAGSPFAKEWSFATRPE
jgi:hypothetical protein